jgi:hypothetical protein
MTGFKGFNAFDFQSGGQAGWLQRRPVVFAGLKRKPTGLRRSVTNQIFVRGLERFLRKGACKVLATLSEA